MILCAMLHAQHCTQYHLYTGKMHSDWFNGIEILQGRWQHVEKVGYCYPSGLEKTLCKWDTHFPTKQLCTNDTVCNAAMQHRTLYHLHMAVLRENAF